MTTDPASDPVLWLAINRQHLYEHRGFVHPVPFAVLNEIGEQPVFCTADNLNEQIDLVQVCLAVLRTNARGELAVAPTGEPCSLTPVPIDLSATERPLLAALRDMAAALVGQASDAPRKPTLLGLLHDPSQAAIRQAVVLIYDWRDDIAPDPWRWYAANNLPAAAAHYQPALIAAAS